MRLFGFSVMISVLSVVAARNCNMPWRPGQSHSPADTASTSALLLAGFVDCMLQNGSASVLAVDTGFGQIAHSLRVDPRVSLMERTNARHLKPGDLPPGLSFLSMDVSFISASLVLPAVVDAAFQHHVRTYLAEAVVLIKPQFEAGREWIGKGGIVRDAEAHQLSIDRIKQAVERLGGREIEVVPSPIDGAEGNKEFLLHALFKPPTLLGDS